VVHEGFKFWNGCLAFFRREVRLKTGLIKRLKELRILSR
jgi:hypothetical protein